MKKSNAKKLQLGKIKIASISPVAAIAKEKAVTTPTIFICPTICTGT